MLESGEPDHAIIFKPFDGSVEGCSDNNFHDFGEQSWKGFLNGQVVTIKDIEEVGQETQNAKTVCNVCATTYADRLCEQCDFNYCKGCFETRHRKVPWSLHTCKMKPEEPRVKAP
jgi:hypothetical protein